MSSYLCSWANGPIRVDLGVTWLTKWRGILGRQGERMLWEGLAHFNVMQNRDNLYFPRATHWIKNTFHVILQIIILFLLQYDEMHFILLNRNISKSILIFEWGNILRRVRHALSQISWYSFEVMACLTVKMMQNTEIYPYFPHDTRWKKRKQCINYKSVNHKLSWSEIIGCKLTSSIK